MLPLILLAILQGIPVPASQAGSITGVLTMATGKPAAGVRVSALTKPDSPSDAQLMSAMAGIAETDAIGAYKLENIPPGRYYIVAGRLDQPTYYSGALEMSAGKDVLITPGAALTGLNFTLKDNSIGRANSGGAMMLAISWTIPVRVIVESGKVPISDNALFPALRLVRVSDNRPMEVPLTSTSMVVPLTLNPEYHVTVENLSSRYRVKAIVSDKADLLTNTLKLPAPPGPIAMPPAASTTLQGPTGARFNVDRSIGRITVNGNTISYTINNTGEFEIPSLLPGRYDLETWISGGKPFTRTIDVGDSDVTIQWPLSIPD